VALREAEAAAVAGMQPVIGGLGRAAFGLVIASGALLTAAMGSPPQDAAVPAMFDWPATVLAGPLTAVAAACVLFAALAPPTHPLASRALRAVMSWRIWAQTGALTYGVFLSHMRWLGFLTLVVWRPALEEVTLPRVLVVASLALLSSAVQAGLMLRLIEAPLLSLVGRRGGESRRTRPKRL
jgi:peptidoglycan/LPS O-acetylase OafA/YrhL